MSDHDDESDEERDPTQCLPWDEILTAQSDEKLQRRGRKEFPPQTDAVAEGCPQCGRPAKALTWIYYTNGDECWMSECGREGWIVACLECRRQADFLLTVMS